MLYCRAAHQLWGRSLCEYQCVDSSREMGDLARVLLTGMFGNLTTKTCVYSYASVLAGGEEIAPEEGSPDLTVVQDRAAIPGVHFRQYLPMSNKVISNTGG